MVAPDVAASAEPDASDGVEEIGGADQTANLQDQAVLALLIHELVHAADDRQHQIHANRTMSFRASFAQSAVFEGHAQWATRQICEQHACSAGLAALDRFMFSMGEPTNELTQSVQALSRNVLEYSYVEGERFIRQLAERENGEALIDDALATPPQDPIQILDPSSFPDHARARRNRALLDATRTLDHPWHRPPFASVETSPLKGINLRAEPENRAAAVDGFTRLITAMIALQLYDQSAPDQPPVEVTLIRTDTNATAALFSSIMHENARATSFREQRQRLPLRGRDGRLMTAAIYVAFEPGLEAREYASLTAATGQHVIQLAAYADSETLTDYALAFLTAVEQAEPVQTPPLVGRGTDRAS